jgi:LysM repeat protein
MIAKTCLILFLGATLYGASESVAIQEMRLSLENVGGRLHGHESELNLLSERLLNLENSVSNFKQELKAANSDKPLEKRVLNLEKAHETLIGDFKLLKTHLNETSSTLAHCQTQLNKIDKQLSSDIQSLKHSLNSMLVLLQGSSGDKNYTVQAGDSLGLIAQKYRTDIKTLKKLNNLSSDVIYSGQKIFLP